MTVAEQEARIRELLARADQRDKRGVDMLRRLEGTSQRSIDLLRRVDDMAERLATLESLESLRQANVACDLTPDGSQTQRAAMAQQRQLLDAYDRKPVEPVKPVALPSLGVCSGHGCRDCFIDRAAIALHMHGVTPNKAFGEAAKLWEGRVAFVAGRKV